MPPCPRRSPWPLALLAFVLALFIDFASPPACAQTFVGTQNYDNGRSGADATETALTPASVNQTTFGKLFTISGLDANVNGQILYVPGVTIGGVRHNVLYAFQTNNADNSPSGLAAFDADNGAPLWRDSSTDASPIIPPSAKYSTAAPVIDPATGTMYVLTKNDNDDTGQTRIHAIDITTGKEKPGSPVLIDRAQVNAPGTGDGSVNGKVYFDGTGTGGTFHANDRDALLFANGTVYAGFAHNTDSFPYHGWIVGYKYDGAQFTLAAKFCATPNGSDGGIWQSGKGMTADAAGNIYCSVGNGTFDANTKGITAGTDYGMCYLKLSPTLQVLDWFAPHDEQTQSNQDLDLGNTGLALIPGTNRLFAGATKFGTGFLLDSTSLGGFTPNGPDRALLRLDGLSNNDNVGQNPIAWDTGGTKYVYVWPLGYAIKQFAYSPTSGTFSPAGVYKQAGGVTAGGPVIVSSNGGANGILWAVGHDGVVHALDATDVSKPELWNSAQNSARDGLGSVGHFQFPVVADGKLFVPTGSASIAVYGLLHPWTATSLSVGPDGYSRLLWDNANGAAAFWLLDSGNRYAGQQNYGPYFGWSAKLVATGPDSKSRALWAFTDGRIALWRLDSTNTYLDQQNYGPYAGWQAQSLSVGADGYVRLLWTNSDGRATVWLLDSADNYVSQKDYGPYAGWTARSVSTGPDLKTRVLWTNGSQAAFWRLDATNNYLDQQNYGPFTGWTAQSLAVGADTYARAVWNNADGTSAFWLLDPQDRFVSQQNYGPYTGLTALGLAPAPDVSSRALWVNTNSAIAVWSVDPNNKYIGQQNFGPY